MKTIQYHEVQSNKTTEGVVGRTPGLNDVTKKTRLSFLPRFKWGWVFRCIIIVFMLAGLNVYILNNIYHIPTQTKEQTANSIIFLSGLFVIFFGSFITAIVSPGKTIFEPAIACALIVIFSTLLNGNPEGAIFGWIIPYFLGLAGARFGESLAGRVSNSKHSKKEKGKDTN